MNESRDAMHSMVTVVTNTALNTGCLLRVSRCQVLPPHTHTRQLCEEMTELTSLNIALMSLCICIPNHHVKYTRSSHLKYVLLLLEKKENKKIFNQ